MVKLFRYFTKKKWGLAGFALCFVVIQVWLDLTMPDYMSEIVDEMILHLDTDIQD